jgi:hypothetical protein
VLFGAGRPDAGRTGDGELNHDWKLDTANVSGLFDAWKCSVCQAYVCGGSPRLSLLDVCGGSPLVSHPDGCVGAAMLDPATPTAKFELGERWYSYDNGRSWTRQQYAAEPAPGGLVVTRIDRQRGEVTLETVKELS